MKWWGDDTNVGGARGRAEVEVAIADKIDVQKGVTNIIWVAWGVLECRLIMSPAIADEESSATEEDLALHQLGITLQEMCYESSWCVRSLDAFFLIG